MGDTTTSGRRGNVFTLHPSLVRELPDSPERELSKAVLLLAIQDLQAGGKRAQKARQFLLSDESDHLFSFRAICRNFGIDPDAARHAIMNRKEIRVERRRAKFKSELGDREAA